MFDPIDVLDPIDCNNDPADVAVVEPDSDRYAAVATRVDAAAKQLAQYRLFKKFEAVMALQEREIDRLEQENLSTEEAVVVLTGLNLEAAKRLGVYWRNGTLQTVPMQNSIKLKVAHDEALKSLWDYHFSSG